MIHAKYYNELNRHSKRTIKTFYHDKIHLLKEKLLFSTKRERLRLEQQKTDFKREEKP
jgi:hypothetical protein